MGESLFAWPRLTRDDNAAIEPRFSRSICSSLPVVLGVP